MLDGLVVMVDGIPHAHPVLVLLAVFAGSWAPSLVRTIRALARPLAALSRHI